MDRKISGITSAAGISFFGTKAKVTIRDKDGSFLVRKYNSVLAKDKNIPFIRGFFKLFNAFKMVVGTRVGKVALGLMGIGVISAILELIFGGSIAPNMIPQVGNIILGLLNILFLLFMMIFIWSIRNLHGLEHKLIHAYKKDLPITLENVKKQKKESPYCGGTLLGVIIFLEIIVTLLHAPYYVLWFLVPTIGYEMFVHAKGNKWYNKALFFPGYLLQLLTTGNNVSDEKILQYIEGFKAFVNAENSQ
jgi:uncharacterized protein YqhQ